MSDHEKELLKEAFKEASKEWLDDKYAAFGKWFIWSFLAPGVFIALFSLYLKFK